MTADRSRPAWSASIAAQLGSRQEAVVDRRPRRHRAGPGAGRPAGRPASPSSTCSARGRSGPWSCSVDPRVLIPRPETEHVVEVALGELDRICDGPGRGRRGGCGRRICVDLGTGSGAIALSLAVEGGAAARTSRCGPPMPRPTRWPWPGPTSDALGRVDPVAAARVRLARGSWFDALPPELVGRVDLLVSNPPYVAESEYPDLDPVGPRLGAEGGAGGGRRERGGCRAWPPSRRSSPAPPGGCGPPGRW